MGMMSSGVFIAGVCSMMLFHPIDSEEQADRIVDLLERSVLMFRCSAREQISGPLSFNLASVGIPF